MENIIKAIEKNVQFSLQKLKKISLVHNEKWGGAFKTDMNNFTFKRNRNTTDINNSVPTVC